MTPPGRSYILFMFSFLAELYHQHRNVVGRFGAVRKLHHRLVTSIY